MLNSRDAVCLQFRSASPKATRGLETPGEWQKPLIGTFQELPSKANIEE